jgi:hypothetical protein
MPRFRANPHLAEELAEQQENRQALRAAAQAVGDRASMFARQAHEPWMRRQAETIAVEEDGNSVAVVNTDYAAHLVEWGGRNNPPHAVLRRAVRAVGLKLHEE